MRIAVDARVLTGGDYSGNILNEVFYPLAKEYKQHQFIFLIDKVNNPSRILPENILPLVITPKPSNFLLCWWWYNVKVPLALKNCRADVFVGINGKCSRTTSRPQVLIVNDLLYKHDAFSTIGLHATHLKKATKISSPSQYITEKIISKYKVARDKIKTTGKGTSYFYKPLNWEVREEIKEQYAEGCEYFIFPDAFKADSDLLNTLKAFTVFKKWQKSNMKLVVIGKMTGDYNKMEEKLKTYKYRNELKIIADVTEQELAGLTGAAYAMVFPSLYQGFATPVLGAMQCGVPVIMYQNSSMSEIAGDTALYAHTTEAAEIAGQMKRIFKDEQLRTRLAELGKERAKLYSWEKTRATTWQLIEEAVSK